MDKSAPSKESLERGEFEQRCDEVAKRHGYARGDWYHGLRDALWDLLHTKVDAIRRERDEVTEKLAEALGKMLERHCRAESPTQCTHLYAVEALAAYRERMGRS